MYAENFVIFFFFFLIIQRNFAKEEIILSHEFQPRILLSFWQVQINIL